MITVFKYILGVCLAIPSASFALSSPPLGVSDTLHEDTLSSLENSSAMAVPIRISAYVSPEHYLNNALVVVKDAKGVVVGRGRTNKYGTLTINPRYTKRTKFPLLIRSSGGRAGDLPFNGSLESLFEDPSYSRVSYLDLITTAAIKITNKKTSYLQAKEKVKSALGMRMSTVPYVLSVRNKYFEHDLYMQELKKSGGYQAFVNKVATYARTDKKINNLYTPNWFEQNKSKSASVIPNAKMANGISLKESQSSVFLKSSASSTSTNPLCTVAVGDGSVSNGTPSAFSIENFGVVGLQILMKVAGVPSTSNNIIAGMLLAAIGGSSSSTVSPELTAIDSVLTDLNCISTQIAYLQDQVDALELQVDLADANACAAEIAGGWEDYTYAVQNADTYPLNASNTSLVGTYLPKWSSINTSCGSAINDSMFGTAGGQAGAWQQLVKNYESANTAGFTAIQVQELQTFLSWWSTNLYQQFVMYNEYLSYYGEFEASLSASGYASTSGSTLLCNAGTTSGTGSYCAYQSNFSSAYPPDLYNDEIGLYNNGYAFNVAPLANSAYNVNNSVSGPLLEAQALALYNSDSSYRNTEDTYSYPGQSAYCGVLLFGAGQGVNTPCTYPSTTYTGSDLIPPANAAYTALGINPYGYTQDSTGATSAVETWYNPLVAHPLLLSSSDVSLITNDQSVYYQVYNTNDYGDNIYNSTTIPFTLMASDTSVQVKLNYVYNLDYDTSTTSYAANYINGFAAEGSDPDGQFGGIMGRVWWTGASSATTYSPPTPPQ